MFLKNNMVSIIIPLYNAEDSILKCLDSVARQTFSGEMEILVINDGSTDNSLELVEKYAANTLLNLKIFSQENKGVSGARNLGLREAKGEYIALLDSDDEWILEKLSIQLECFNNHPKYSFLGGLIYEPKLNNKDIISEIKLKDLIFKNYFQPSTVIFKKEVLQHVGYFDESQNYAEEGNYFYRVANKYKCGLINQKVVIYGQGKVGFGVSGLSANLKEMEKGELRNLRFALKQDFISIPTYAVAVIFSLLKYVRRLLIVKLNVE